MIDSMFPYGDERWERIDARADMGSATSSTMLDADEKASYDAEVERRKPVGFVLTTAHHQVELAAEEARQRRAAIEERITRA